MPSRAVSLVDLVVHELRTPLTVAIGSLRQIRELDDPMHQAALTRALRSCERVEQLVGQLRDWARLEDSPAAEPAAIALSQVLGEAVRVASAARPGVHIAAGDVPEVMVRALPHLIAEAVASLLSALARASDAGDVLTIEAAVTGTLATIVASRIGAPGEDVGTFEAEWLGGLGFSLPLARAVIAGGGGGVGSTHAADGRLQAISVRLAVAPTPSR
jgi:signal transduction histidine kinase